MKNILLGFIVAITLTACNTNAEPVTNILSDDNYVVVLDLSDRLIQNPNQVDIDTSAICALFEKFENSFRNKHIVVKSKDKFTLRIVPQKNSSLAVNFYENKLSIDMGMYNAAEKLKRFEEFKSAFSVQLKSLYQSAILGSSKTDFEGVDIWQYFNQQINSDLIVKYNNRVLILTDGYFDFEDKNHGLQIENQSTTTAPLLAKMSGTAWKDQAEKLKLGIVPVKLNIPAKWLVCGIQARPTSIDLMEANKLSYLWIQWLAQSGAGNVLMPILNSSSSKVQSLIKNNL